jgi:hypothetical protein
MHSEFFFFLTHPSLSFTINFSFIRNPIPLVRVGQKGSIGSIEIQDLIFTSKQHTAGVIFVEWNIKAVSPGAAAMWGGYLPRSLKIHQKTFLKLITSIYTDCHVRVGGAKGTDLTTTECTANNGDSVSVCNGGSLLMHITSESSAYLENVWLWVADRWEIQISPQSRLSILTDTHVAMRTRQSKKQMLA